MIKALIKLGCNINPSNPKFEPTLIYIIWQIYSKKTIEKQNYLISILQLLFENDATLTKEMIELYGDDIINMLIKTSEETATEESTTEESTTEESTIEEPTTCQCSLM